MSNFMTYDLFFFTILNLTSREYSTLNATHNDLFNILQMDFVWIPYLTNSHSELYFTYDYGKFCLTSVSLLSLKQFFIIYYFDFREGRKTFIVQSIHRYATKCDKNRKVTDKRVWTICDSVKRLQLYIHSASNQTG